MPLTITNRALLLAALTAVAAPSIAQRYTPPPPPPLTTEPCKPTKKDPCPPPADAKPAPANPFPFPGEDAADTPGQTSTAKPAAKAAAPADSSQNPFPFPGEAPDMPADALVPTPGAPPAASSSSSSSSTGDPADARNPDEPALKDEGSSGSTRFSRRKLPKVEDMGARESKDVEVANYYLTTGNLQAAYARATDAVKIDTTDPAAHMALAQAAKRLSKTEEARAEYQQVLKNDPSDKQIKEANRALVDLGKPQK